MAEKQPSGGKKLALAAGGALALFGLARWWRGKQSAAPSVSDYRPADVYGDQASAGFVSPVRLERDPMEWLFIYNFDDDDEYEGLELQYFDHPDKGQGAATFMWRKDGKVDFYLMPGVRIDREKAEVGSGVGEWTEQDFDFTFAITPQGVQCTVDLVLKDGRPLRLVLREHRQRFGKPLTILAPMGISIANPRFMPLFWMTDIDLARVAGTEATLTIGDANHPPSRLPVPIPYSGQFSYFVRACPDPLIVPVNAQHDGPLPVLAAETAAAGASDGMIYDLRARDGHHEIARAAIQTDKHEVSLRLTPPLPALLDLRDGANVAGRFALGVDEHESIIAGLYRVERVGDDVTLLMRPTDNWQPHGSLMERLTMYFFPPFFRTWPKTYEWSAVVKLDADGEPVMQSQWRRIE